MNILSLSGIFHDKSSILKGLRRFRLFFGLSRTPHGILDMTAPGLVALLWLGTFPGLRTIILGLLTVFAGYTAVYALNDVMDFRSDKEKIRQGGFQDSDNYLDAAILRHPLAHGLISLREALLWITFWGLIALLGAYRLNPFCIVIFAAGCMLEILYCLLWKISPLRIFIAGAVKTCGPIAAILAVDPVPSMRPLLMVFLWFFLWEMGGQNIPNDWAEIEEDMRSKAKTVLVSYGRFVASGLALICLCLTVMLGFYIFQQRQGLVPAVAAFLASFFLLLQPGFNLFIKKARSQALVLFNRASYYPALLLIVVSLNILLFMGQ